jgi:hypothetical protein
MKKPTSILAKRVRRSKNGSSKRCEWCAVKLTKNYYTKVSDTTSMNFCTIDCMNQMTVYLI